MTPTAGKRRTQVDVGSATVWMVFATVIVLAVCGLVYDGGTLITAKQQALNNAETAARAGAQAIDLNTLYTGGPARLDPNEATARADAFLHANGWTGTATATTTAVTVTVTITQPMTFLQTFGLGPRVVNGTATAQAQQGFANP